jgi:hypothetical protein
MKVFGGNPSDRVPVPSSMISSALQIQSKEKSPAFTKDVNWQLNNGFNSIIN